MVSTEIIHVPYDSILLGIDAYEIHHVSSQVLSEVLKKPGHYTVKLPPTHSKREMHDYAFYYCDTLIEPFCSQENFIYYAHNAINYKLGTNIDGLISLSQNAFMHGRFHRDFNVSMQYADDRYINWLRKLNETHTVYALYHQDDVAGFIAVVENKLVLHALRQEYKGKGLAKYFWSKVCMDLYEKGHTELTSSISAANLAALNLYASLGFCFRNAVDVYHRLVI